MKVNEDEIRESWEKSGIYNAEMDDREKFFITAAFPYPNSPQHIGHARTYTITDVYARYMRMRGYNVLFPMGFHVTGTPILAMAERIKENDQELLRIFEEIYGIKKEVAKNLTNPKDLVMYFSKEIEEGMKLMGYSIDWTRKFYTFDGHFNKFIEWQFKKLKDKGLLIKGSHYIPWSIKLNSAVGAHDTKGDVDPELEEVVAIKFKFRDGYVLTLTYRPETIYGVTNIWVNPESKIVKVKHKEEFYYITKEAFQNLKHQLEMEMIQELNANEILNEKVINPETKEEVPIYPAKFVKKEEGTGIVMSVPAHAPYDYAALKDLGKTEIKKIIELKGYDIPAKEIVERMGIKNQNDEKLEMATKEIYKKEFKEGKMMVFKPGLSVAKAKEEVKEKLISQGKALMLWVIANSPVYTRAGDKVVVKKVNDQWFINYGDAEWKNKSKECLERMSVIPGEIKLEIKNTIDWLDRKACTRAKGLGTRFPFDKNQMIEALSDSTIYMAFYTLMPEIKEFSVEELNEDFFDYVFYGKGNPKNEKHEKLRKKFLYWYPLDSRHSGADLTRNHLTFFIMNHVAIFPEEFWPKQIVVNGFVLMEGKKMSKSLGNILPLKKAVKEYGADVVRLAVISGAELLQNTDFNKSVVEGIKNRLKFFIELGVKEDSKDSHYIDEWILERIKSRASKIEELFNKFDYREIVLELFYETYRDLQWYLERRGKGKKLKEFFDIWVPCMAPFIPYTTEFLWKKMGKDYSVCISNIPRIEGFKGDVIKLEEILKDIDEKVENILNIVQQKNIKVENIFIFIPDEWKYSLFNDLSNFNGKDIIGFVKEKYNERIDEFMKIFKKLKNKIYSIEKVPEREKVINYLNKSKTFLEKKYKLNVNIVEEKEAKHEKAKNSIPTDIAVLLE